MPAVKPTRQEALKLKKKIKTASRGHSLLTDKRDGLIQEFLAIIQEVIKLRGELTPKIVEAIQLFRFAQTKISTEAINELIHLSQAKTYLELQKKSIMGVTIPHIIPHLQGDPFQYGTLGTPKDLDQALLTLQNILPLLVKLAEIEFTARLLAEEIEATRRRVNALEYVIIPEMKTNLKSIQNSLDELTRQEKVTIMKVKEILGL
jgi:V/A-type H+-transporting ATPase subunit D